jgi:hypothetical protein
MTPVTETEVEKVTKNLKGKLLAGIDGIPCYIVKKCIEYIKNPLAHIYNASLESCTFPDRIKMVKV